MATYYIDPTNGNDAHTGLKEGNYTADALTTDITLIDTELTEALDDAYNGDFLYNVTRGAGALITDYVAATTTITCNSISGQTAGDTYYILKAWLDLDTFTEAARSAGDKVIIRRGAVQCDDGTDLNFTSDGTIAAPIVIEADFDNAWDDQVDLSATATATLTFGSKTVTFSADISGSLAAGDWIYASGDSNKEFAYKVASVVTTTVTLKLPYKGAQAGSGKTMYNILDNPLWNTAAGNFQWNFDTDNFWLVQGLHIRGTDANGNVELDSSFAHEFIDCEFEGDGTSAFGIEPTDDEFVFFLKKCIFSGHQYSINSGVLADTWGKFFVDDSIFTGDATNPNVAFRSGTTQANSIQIYGSENEFVNGTNTTALSVGTNTNNEVRLRNPNFNTSPIGSSTAGVLSILSIEDYDNTVGDNRFYQIGSGSNINTVLYQSETTTVRSGGSNKSVKITPTTNMTITWDFNKLKVFEIPIYATTDSKTYTVYFNLPDANFTADPTASELWIELEAWGHATNNFRKITKSTGTITSDGNWNSLTVTVAPAQAGVAYLRCWYAKTKEAGSNIFFVDPIPTIT